MADRGGDYQLFETARGHAAIAWRATRITAVRLPADTAAQAERALLRRLPEAGRADPPALIANVINGICRYFAGETTDFTATPVDLGEQPVFFASVYDHVRQLGWGESTTYGAVAKALGVGSEFARDVGAAMAANPIPLIVPCHRVLAAGGKVGGFSAPGGSVAKAWMLTQEGIAVAPPPAQAGFVF